MCMFAWQVISRDEARRLNAVEFDFKNVSSIAKALGNAGKVVVTVGPTEDGPLGKVTRDDAARVLEAATLSNAAHFVLVTEPGTGVSADNGPLARLFGLFSKVFSKGSELSDSDLVDKIVETSLPYTIIKAASTDGVDDYAPESGNLVVEAEGALDPSAKVRSSFKLMCSVSMLCLANCLPVYDIMLVAVTIPILRITWNNVA
jgi:hypothetical protein